MPAIGDSVPDFELLNQDGQTVKLSDFRGQKVVIFAYPAADTPGCTTQACSFRDEFPRIQTAQAVVLGVSPDTPADLKAWQKKINLPYQLLSDPEHKMLEAWGAWGEKNMFGNLLWGVIRSHWVIDEEGKLLDAQLKVKADESVVKALKVLEG